MAKGKAAASHHRSHEKLRGMIYPCVSCPLSEFLVPESIVWIWREYIPGEEACALGGNDIKMNVARKRVSAAPYKVLIQLFIIITPCSIPLPANSTRRLDPYHGFGRVFAKTSSHRIQPYSR
jgi:hypothetical protein